MEAAGLMNNFPCLVIRGICDYANSHKNDWWQPYAAITVAAYAKEFLETVEGGEVQQQTPLAEQLEEIVEIVDDIRYTTTATNLAVQAAQLKDWLSPPDPAIHYLAVIDERNKGVVGTGSWFLKNSEFFQWNSTENSFLWLHGGAGCGTTVLASTVIQHLLSKTKNLPDRIVLYYYFTFTDKHTRSLSSLMQSLVIQLSQQDERARKELQGLRANKNGSQPSYDELFEAFNSMTSRFNCVMIVLDGLDELEIQKRLDVLHWITNVTSGAITDMRILASSRSEHDIETKLKGVHLEVQLRPEMIQGDIKEYVHKQVHDGESQLRKWRQRPNVQLEIEDTLTKKAHGMFRWVVCQMQAIEECLDLPSLRERLNTLPETLDATYDRMIQSLLKWKQKGAIALLQFLTFTGRSLFLEEAVDVIAVDLSSRRPFNPENRMPDQLEIVKMCSSLVVLENSDERHERSREVDPRIVSLFPHISEPKHFEYSKAFPSKKRLQLAHFSVKEYLISDRIQGTLQHHFAEVNGYASIVNICLEYLTNIPKFVTHDREKIVLEFPLLLFIKEAWPKHAKFGEKNDQTVEMIKNFFKDKSILRHWLYLFFGVEIDTIESGIEELNPILLSILLELEATALSLIKDGVEVEVKALPQTVLDALRVVLFSEPLAYFSGHDRRLSLQTPLYMAASKGFYEVVRVLISKGANVHKIGGLHGTPLNAACFYARNDVATLLLEHSDKSRDDYGQYIKNGLDKALDGKGLYWNFVASGHTVVEKLVDIYIGPVDFDPSLDRCLYAAFILDDLDLEKSLLKKGGLVDETTLNMEELFERDETILVRVFRLISKGHLGDFAAKAFNRLLRRKDNEFSPLHEAVRRSFYEALSFLVAHGTEHHITDTDGRTSLLLAVMEGDKRATEILLDIPSLATTSSSQGDREEYSTFVNMTDSESSKTALHWAAERGFTEIAQMLLSRGADLTAMDSSSRTALHWAAFCGSTDTVQMLLLEGADVGAMDDFGATPIHYAASRDHLEVVKLLGRYGSDLTICSYRGLAPLECANAGLRASFSDWSAEQFLESSASESGEQQLSESNTVP